MRRNKRIIAMLLGMTMAIPFLSSTVSLAVDQENTDLHMPKFEHYQQFRKAKMTGSAMSPLVTASENSASYVNLPASYDLRWDGLVTSVKNQNPYGTCWAHAAMASLESGMIARNAAVDLSEWYQAYYNYCDMFGYRMDDSGADWYDQGGNYTMLSSMLAGWVGVVDEADFPYDDWSVLNGELTLEGARAESDYHVTDINMLPYEWYMDDLMETDVPRIKQVIYDGHAVALNYFDADSYYSEVNNSYFYNGYYDDGGYHAVTIVGWDDSFSADNFIVTPPGDGAWLCKNSWGEYWGNGGYFWISYYDESIFDVYYLEAEPAVEGMMNYQHDDYGYWSAVSIGDYGDSSAWMANIFTAEEDTWLTDVMFCSSMDDGYYEAIVYSDLQDLQNPSSGVRRAAASGMITSSGYHTVELDTPVFVSAGETFSVAVNQGYNNPYETGWCITCESSYEMTETYPDGSVYNSDSYITEEAIRRDFAPGESFYSLDGEEWSDTYYETIVEEYSYEDEYGDMIDVVSTSVIGNVCVKAIGSFGSYVTFSDYEHYQPYGAEIELQSFDGGPIYYMFDDEDGSHLYDGPIVLTRDCKIYAWTPDSDVCSQTYSIQHAQLSSILAVDQDAWAEYMTLTQETEDTWTVVYNYFEDSMPPLLNLMPISTETIRINGTLVQSGYYYTIHPSDDMEVTIEVTGENLLPTTYIVRMEPYEYVDYGDVNLDGEIDAVDAAEILVYSAAVGAGEAPELPDDEWLLRADYDFDGYVDAVDAAEILYYAALAGAGEVFG